MSFPPDSFGRRFQVGLGKHAVALISLAVALFGASYNTWRNQTTEVHLDVLLYNIVRKFQEQARSKNIKLQLMHNDKNIMIGALLDLERLFYNIVQNAINYNKAGGHIEVSKPGKEGLVK